VTRGYAGKILWVDLREERLTAKDLDGGMTRKYIGGVGFAAKILWDETTADTKSFSPENPLIFMTGPLTGFVPSSSRYIVSAISPLTNIFGVASAGGNWAVELKQAGFDGIVIKGESKKPVYLWVNNEIVDIVDANHLWGKDTYEVCELLRKETDEKASVATIGPAGEKRVRIAGIISDGKVGRAAARCGLGAVMGFKKLKAVVVRGSRKPKAYDDKKLRESVERVYPRMTEEPEKGAVALRNYVKAVVPRLSEVSAYPIKNWLEGEFKGFADMAIELWTSGKPYYCRTCRTSCIDSAMTTDGRLLTYEALFPLGSQCLIDNAEALQKAYTLCNRYGLDTISVGGVISFAMECFERGLITLEDTGGINLKWGDHEAMIEMIKKIGEKEGFGELLGRGVKTAAERIGGSAHEFAVHVKGLETPAHDPRVGNRLAVHYATTSRGGDHLEGGLAGGIARAHDVMGKNDERFYRLLTKILYRVPLGKSFRKRVEKRMRKSVHGKGKQAARIQNFMCVLDSLICCLFLVGIGRSTEGRSPQIVWPSHFTEWLNYVTGWKMNLGEFMKTGERIFNLKRMINVRRGISRKDDILPPRLLVHKHAESASLPFLGEMLSEYYSYRGWSEQGVPTKEKLTELDLNHTLSSGF